ncbi:MAG: FAD/NAD(P)-binding oxidoreductase, partial [Clostridia bacterium]|nr:FAD/NAD(P)-binding oxidoreductase [Clostridia bacterium]
MKKYIIIGASAAGLACAEQIRKEDSEGSITVLTREAYLPYSRPSISYYLKGAVKENDMYLRSPNYYKEKGIDIVTNAPVRSIDKK